MDPTIAFFRGLPSDGMCCESVAAWLRTRGVDTPYSRAMMLRMWRRGVRLGAQLAARRMGFKRVPLALARPGDIVLIEQQDGSELLGVRCLNGLSVARAGALLITSDAPLMVWRL